VKYWYTWKILKAHFEPYKEDIWEIITDELMAIKWFYTNDCNGIRWCMILYMYDLSTTKIFLYFHTMFLSSQANCHDHHPFLHCTL
jgi:hypothetical protein